MVPFSTAIRFSGPEPIHDGDVLKVGVSLFWFVIEAVVGASSPERTSAVDVEHEEALEFVSEAPTASPPATEEMIAAAVQAHGQSLEETIAPRPPEWAHGLDNLAGDNRPAQATDAEAAEPSVQSNEFVEIAAEEFLSSSGSEEAAHSAPAANQPSQEAAADESPVLPDHEPKEEVEAKASESPVPEPPKADGDGKVEAAAEENEEPAASSAAEVAQTVAPQELSEPEPIAATAPAEFTLSEKRAQPQQTICRQAHKRKHQPNWLRKVQTS